MIPLGATVRAKTDDHYNGREGVVVERFPYDEGPDEYNVRMKFGKGIRVFDERELEEVDAGWVDRAAKAHRVGSTVDRDAEAALREAKPMLDFSTGATRNRKENELQYEGFLSPLALQMFGEYMHSQRVTADGSVRDSDNWQKGIPEESYRDSLLRHVMDIWLIYRGWPEKARDGGDKRKALAGAFFNLQGLMHSLALEEMGK